MLDTLKRRARALKTDTYALYLACRDPRTPWYAKLLAAVVVAYAFSPLDLIPDFIPVLGYLDDLILVPLGIAVVIKLVPASVMAECRERARAPHGKPTSRAAAVLVITIWLVAALVVVLLLRDFLDG